MSENNNKSNNDISRNELNDQLDELCESQQDPADFDDIANDTPRSWWTYFWWGLCAVGGLFLFWRTSCAPQVTCYVIEKLPFRDKTPVQEPDDSPEIMCYDVVIEDIDDESAPEPSPADTDPAETESEQEQ